MLILMALIKSTINKVLNNSRFDLLCSVLCNIIGINISEYIESEIQSGYWGYEQIDIVTEAYKRHRYRYRLEFS